MILLKFLPVALLLHRQVLAKVPIMDVIRQWQSIAWCKPDWCFPSMSKETNELLRQCANLPKLELSDDVEEIIKKSKAFPIPFPIETIRLERLKMRRPIERLKKNIASTYPVIHERVLLLMTHFLIYKREFGSSIEKAFYKDMTVPELIDRLLKKRAAVFMGPEDTYKLVTGQESEDGWESVGTLQQKPPLLLENCLSYDEMKLSAFVYVSSPTECINNGSRHNEGIESDDDAETHAVIVGQIGARFERTNRMDYEDIVITEQQNRLENGYGEEVTPTTCLNVLKTTYVRNNQSARHMWRQMWAEFYQNRLENGYGEEVTPTTCLNVLKTTYVRNNQSARHMWRQMWAEFYQVHSVTYEELISYVTIETKSEEKQYTDRYIPIGDTVVFDNEVYYKRISVLAESALLEAENRAKEAEKDAFVNVIGCGLGVWSLSRHQNDVYILTFLERIRSFLKKDLLNHVSDVNFAYIRPSSGIVNLFSVEKRIFLESKRHPRGGINVQLENREPSAKLTGEHEGKLLVMNYPWDGNALPGNEFWLGSLSGSGDPATASSTQVSELHNPHINPAVTGHNTRVVGKHGMKTLSEYCASYT